MVRKDINVNDLAHFDFVGDAEDTIMWLESQDRPTEALLLKHRYEDWQFDEELRNKQ